MRLYFEQGNRSMALRQYQICRDNLQRELGVKTDPETEQLYRDIQSTSKRVTKVASNHSPEHSPGNKEAILSVRKPFRKQIIVAGFLSIVLAVGAGWMISREVSPELKPVVAVLPFDDLAGDKDSHRLARGLTEDIITDLGRASEFKVLARNTTAVFDDKVSDPVKAGAALHAAFVVDGSIQRQANRVRITAQLFDAANGKSLWSQRWDQSLALHFHEAGFGGEIGVTGAFEFTAFLNGFGAKNFAEQAVAGFPFAGAFALGVVLEIEGAIGVVGDKTIAVAARVLKCLADDCRLNFGGAELADGLGHRF